MEKKIKTIIAQLGDIAEKISHLPSEKPAPSIEKDIILADIRNLYDAVKSLQDSSLDIPSGEKERQTKSQKPDESATIGKQTGDLIPEAKPSASEELSPAKGPSPAEATETVKEETAKPEKKEDGKPDEPEILADRYKGDKNFINESLAGKKQDIGSKIHSTPIRNIHSALGINDRFTLINELFNGDKDSFQNTIGILDDASNFNEAFNYISSSFEWDMEDESVQMLLDLVRRKFIVNQNE